MGAVVIHRATLPSVCRGPSNRRRRACRGTVVIRRRRRRASAGGQATDAIERAGAPSSSACVAVERLQGRGRGCTEVPGRARRRGASARAPSSAPRLPPRAIVLHASPTAGRPPPARQPPQAPPARPTPLGQRQRQPRHARAQPSMARTPAFFSTRCGAEVVTYQLKKMMQFLSYT
jgi:hypothetical protein